jgi:NADPH-dependent glutamate synthase beta subunit-like oxidoreductase
MAKIQVQEATVERIITDKGIFVTTSFNDREGTPRKEKFTVWGQPAGIKVGDKVNVTGNLSVRVEEFEGDAGQIRYAAVHINNPKIDAVVEDLPF